MPYLSRGALIEYGSDFLGPIPNVVLFQFNPESLSRDIQIPSRSTESTGRETHQAGMAPVERISLTAHFSAADQLNEDHPLARLFGIGPQLAALEKMVYPAGRLSGLIGEGLDAIGDAIFRRGGDGDSTQPIPREQYPRILFVWGLKRVLPILIDSMQINEQHYDAFLNPIQAEVALSFSVLGGDPCSDDMIARGALEYTNLAKDTQAMANLANTVSQVVEIVSF